MYCHICCWLGGCDAAVPYPSGAQPFTPPAVRPNPPSPPQVFGTDVNGLPLSLDLSWLEQKAVIILLTLLVRGGLCVCVLVGLCGTGTAAVAAAAPGRLASVQPCLPPLLLRSTLT